jgi:hypothetical protein
MGDELHSIYKMKDLEIKIWDGWPQGNPHAYHVETFIGNSRHFGSSPYEDIKAAKAVITGLIIGRCNSREEMAKLIGHEEPHWIGEKTDWIEKFRVNTEEDKTLEDTE